MMPVIGSTPKFNLTATANPAVTDDEDAGYTVGSLWVNTSTNAVFTCTDSTVSAAVWMDTSGDATGPASSLDLEVAVFSGTGGKTLAGSGVRNYGALAADPASPTPQAGDAYYSTALEQDMRYDGTRSKWLSATTLWDGAGRNGSTGAGAFYRRFNGMIMATTIGPVIPKSTIVGITMNAQTAVTHTLEVLVGGSVVATLASGGAALATDYTIDADVAQGVLSVRNQAGSSATASLQCTVYYKLRA